MVSQPGRGFDSRQLHNRPPKLYAKAGFFIQAIGLNRQAYYGLWRTKRTTPAVEQSECESDGGQSRTP